MITLTYYQQTRVNGKWINETKPHISEITLEQFIQSFVKERWQNEKRYNKQYTKLGYFHTKTIVKFDDNTRSVREFAFPN